MRQKGLKYCKIAKKIAKIKSKIKADDVFIVPLISLKIYTKQLHMSVTKISEADFGIFVVFTL